MRPPDWFIRALALLDPDLRVRWGGTGRWVVEQKSFVPPSEIYYLKRREARLAGWVAAPKVDQSAETTEKNLVTWQDLAERLASAGDGYRVLFYPERLDQQAYEQIVLGQHARYGGYSAFFDKLEEKEAEEERKLAARHQSKRENVAGEFYDIVDFIGRKKIGDLAAGTKTLGEIVHGDRSRKVIDWAEA